MNTKNTFLFPIIGIFITFCIFVFSSSALAANTSTNTQSSPTPASNSTPDIPCKGSTCGTSSNQDSSIPQNFSGGTPNNIGSGSTKTKIPIISNTICGDLLACDHPIYGAAQTLKPGIDQSYFFNVFLPWGIKLILNLAGGIAVLMLVYAGIWYIIASGESGTHAKINMMIMYTLIGLICIILARAIVTIIENLPLT